MHRMILLAALVAALAAGCSEPAGPEPVRLPTDLKGTWRVVYEGLSFTESIVANDVEIVFLGISYEPKYNQASFSGTNRLYKMTISGTFAGRELLSIWVRDAQGRGQRYDCSR